MKDTDYDFSNHEVRMKLYGKLLDVNYTKRLQNEDISLEETIRLDRLQKELFVKKSVDQNNDGENTQKSAQKIEESRQKSAQKILQLIKENQSITTTKMAEKLQMSRSGIAKQIKKLQEDGKVIRIGSDKGGHWEIVK